MIGGALLIGGNGGVVWAEQYVSSGLAALFVSTLPIWMAVLDRVVYGQPIVPRVLAGLVLGFGGVALLIGRVETGGAEPLVRAGTARRLARRGRAARSMRARRRCPAARWWAPPCRCWRASVWLLLASVLAGEPGRLHAGMFTPQAVAAVVYLTLVGSLVGFTAYIWLLGVAPISLVSTYAYVNPVVAVLLGWALLGEPITCAAGGGRARRSCSPSRSSRARADLDDVVAGAVDRGALARVDDDGGERLLDDRRAERSSGPARSDGPS